MPDLPPKELSQLEKMIPRIPGDLLELRFRRDTYSFLFEQVCRITRNALLGSRGTVTSDVPAYLVSGTDETDSSGVVTLNLNSLICGAAFRLPTRAPQFVATPVSGGPALVTVAFKTQEHQGTVANGIANGPYLTVDVVVSSWKLDGSSAPHVRFSWVCTLEAAAIAVGG